MIKTTKPQALDSQTWEKASESKSKVIIRSRQANVTVTLVGDRSVTLEHVLNVIMTTLMEQCPDTEATLTETATFVRTERLV